jgi:arylsulfatase A-like enzyme
LTGYVPGMGEYGCRAALSADPRTTASPDDPPGGVDGGDEGVDQRWLIAAGVIVAGAAGAGVLISRRRFLGMSALVGAVMAAPAFGATRAARAAETRPNIVWFRSEDNGAEFIGAYGNPTARTPNIDRLAAEGVRFDRFFTTSPVCAPTKLGWATGMYEAGMGPGANMRAQGRRPGFAAGFATWLAAAGYWCTTSGNADYNTDLVDDHGFHDTSGDWQVGVETGMPFIALLGSSTTHEISMAGATPTSTDPAAVELPSYVPDDPVLREDRAAYLDKVAAMDQEVGALMAELAELGVAENTIVIYSSDHGGVLPRSKRFCYDSGLRAPLVAWFPPAWQHLAPGAPGSVIDDPVSSIDAPATMLHLAGVEIPQHFQGQPFAGRTCAPRQFAFGNRNRNRMDEAIDFVRTVRDQRYRYIRNYMPHLPWGQHIEFMWGQAGYRRWEQLHLEGSLTGAQDRFWRDKPYEELYDLDSDPDEVVNLVDDPGNLPALLDALGDDNEIVRYWAALGCSMLGVVAASAADELSSHMDDAGETRWVRVQCADALERAGNVDAAVTFLGAVAGDETEPFPTRLQAVQSLLFLGPEAIAGRDGLLTAAATANEYVSVAGAHALQVVDGTYAPAP